MRVLIVPSTLREGNREKISQVKPVPTRTHRTQGGLVRGEQGPKMLQGSFDVAFPLKHQRKDLRLALQLARDLGRELPLSAAADSYFVQVTLSLNGLRPGPPSLKACCPKWHTRSKRLDWTLEWALCAEVDHAVVPPLKSGGGGGWGGGWSRRGRERGKKRSDGPRVPLAGLRLPSRTLMTWLEEQKRYRRSGAPGEVWRCLAMFTLAMAGS